MTTNQETAVRHEFEHIVYGSPQCSCGFGIENISTPLHMKEEAVRDHILREDHARLAEENARLRAALEDIHLQLTGTLSRIPASDEAEGREAIGEGDQG